MSTERSIVIAIEDLTTLGAVAAAAVRQAVAESATVLVLVHVLDEHTLVNGILGVTGAIAPPLMESEGEATALLTTAEQLIVAQFTALERPAPAFRHEIGHGHVGEALAHVVQRYAASCVVLGARRPHLFGRLSHPDVHAHLAGHLKVPVYVAPLQEV